MLVSKTSDREIRRTDLGNMKATWEIRNSVPRVMFLVDHTSGKPAYRWPDFPMASCPTGHISFDPEEYPTLAQVIQWLPQYEATLWEHIRTEYRSAQIGNLRRTPGCTEGRSYTEAEHSAWLKCIVKSDGQ